MTSQIQCPDPQLLSDFAAGRLSSEGVAQVEAHIGACGPCLALVGGFVRAAPAPAAAVCTEGPTDCIDGEVDRAPVPALLERGSTFGRYTVLHLVGVGAMGAVYAAYDGMLDRKVALKVLHPVPGEAVDAAHARLVFEAKAMAKLAHPHVVPVFDVARHETQLALAMEFVRGKSLALWLRESSRGWQEILDVFLQAADGLSAAHHIGLVHRDFKPANVLVGADGRVRVTDFGLATTERRHPDSAGRARGLVGTLAYMAPEALAGEPPQIGSDQFSFCVALYEALYGQRPYAGEDAPTLLENMLAGRLRTPPNGRAAPSWLRRALVRGLEPAPKDRFGSMEALAASLRRGRSRRRRQVTGSLALGLALMVALVTRETLEHRSARCEPSAAKLAGIWDDARKAQLRRAFHEAKLPSSAQTWDAVEKVLDGYASAWVKIDGEACVAARIERTQSTQLWGLRTVCLEQRRRALGALSDALAQPDARTIARAETAALALPELSACEDAQRLALRVELPADPERRAKAESIRSKLDAAKVRLDLAQVPASMALAETALEEARALMDRPVLAEAYLRRGQAASAMGEPGPAEAHLRRSLVEAQASRHDEVLAWAWCDLAIVAGYAQARHPEAELYADMAAAAVQALGSPPSLLSRVATIRGYVLKTRGRHAEASAAVEEALRIVEGAHGPAHPSTIPLIDLLGRTKLEVGEYAEATALIGRALERYEARHGPRHPAVGAGLQPFGTALAAQGRYEEAEAALRRGVEILQRTQPSGWTTASVQLSLSEALVQSGKYTEAIALAREALRVTEAALGADNPRVAESHTALALALGAAGRTAEALGHAETALPVWEKAMGANHPAVAYVLALRGDLLCQRGRCREGLASAELAAERAGGLYGTQSVQYGRILNTLAAIHERGGSSAEAAEAYARACAILEQPRAALYPERLRCLDGQGRVALARGDARGSLGFHERALATSAAVASADRPESLPALLGTVAARLALNEPARVHELFSRAMKLSHVAGAAERRQLRAILASGKVRAQKVKSSAADGPPS